MKDVRIERHWFHARLWDKSPKIGAIVNDVRGLAQASKAPASSSSSNISKKKEWIKTFLDSLDNCSDEDEEKNC